MFHTETLSRVRAVIDSRPVLIWGAGRAGVTAARYLRDQQLEPAAFIDSAPRAADVVVEGLSVYPPAHIASLRDRGDSPFVVVASVHAAEIARQAESLGVVAPADLSIWQPPPDPFIEVAAPVPPDFYAMLHELRGHALADMPPGARTILSAGCSGRWYFDWVEQQYGRVARHIGVENYLPRPDDLPDNVTWLPRDIMAVPEVQNDSIDLVFSGQNVEHLWPEQLAGFLLEAHRVLAPGGWLVVDSPNRAMTDPLNWTHPEHTIELSVPEIREILDLAGFDDTVVRGLWLCEDRGRLLPLTPQDDARTHGPEVLRRSALARTRPEASFLWWAEARKRREPRREELSRALARMFAASWPERLNRFIVPGPVRTDAEGRWALMIADTPGLIAEGPVFPLRAGRSRLRFRVRGDDRTRPCTVRLDLSRGLGDRQTLITSASVTCLDTSAFVEVVVDLAEEMTFGFRTRLWNTGDGPGEVLLNCEHVLETSC
jgi:SAM-dependent methyltransferase